MAVVCIVILGTLRRQLLAQIYGVDLSSPILCGAPGMVSINFLSELPSVKEKLNQVSSVSVLTTSSMALANKGLFELIGRP